MCDDIWEREERLASTTVRIVIWEPSLILLVVAGIGAIKCMIFQQVCKQTNTRKNRGINK